MCTYEYLLSQFNFSFSKGLVFLCLDFFFVFFSMFLFWLPKIMQFLRLTVVEISDAALDAILHVKTAVF